MGQAANNGGRNASLDQQKSRAAGRRGRTGQDQPERQAIRDAGAGAPMKGKTAGASGREGKANRGGSVASQGAGGGGGGPTAAKDSHISTPASTRPARRRG